MLFERFLDAISIVIPGLGLSESEAEALSALNPSKIYVENVRSILGVSQPVAAMICEAAVRQGFLSRGVEVLCPDGTVAASAENESELPEMVNCLTEKDGELEEFGIPTKLLKVVTFYSLNEPATAVIHRSTT
jgi:hypothetical protein